MQIYSKTCVKRPLSKGPKIGFQDQLSLNAGQKYCRMLQGKHSAILLAFIKAKKRKCVVSGYPNDPNILGPTQTFLKTFRILKSIFILFPYKRVFLKKKVCLPTDPKNFEHVTRNKIYFSFGLSYHM